jgi:ketosteroid isomerase-like protein
MKRRSLMMMTPALFAAAGSAAEGSKDEKEVMAAMEAYRQASMKKDRAALERLLHPDLTYTHSSAKTETKAEMIDALLNSKTSQSIDFSETKARVYGKAAIVKGKVTLKPTTDGKEGNPFALVISHVWIKGGQGWQLVDRQATRPPAT